MNSPEVEHENDMKSRQVEIVKKEKQFEIVRREAWENIILRGGLAHKSYGIQSMSVSVAAHYSQRAERLVKPSTPMSAESSGANIQLASRRKLTSFGNAC
jgi:hypothetical protein